MKNTATATGTPTIGASTTVTSNEVTVPAVVAATIQTIKSTTAVSFAAVGDQLSYDITVTNTGNVTLTSVAVSDPKADATPVCAAGSLAPGVSTTCTAVHTVTQADLDAGSVTNTATSTGTPPSGAPVTDPSDPVVVPATIARGLTTTKALGAGSITAYAAVGDVIDYVITVRNAGNVTLTGISVSDPKADATPICTPTTLAPGDITTCAATHTVTQADLDAGSVSNTATGSGTPPTGAPVTDASDPVVVPATASPVVTTGKALDPASITTYSALGDVISYVITVQNSGNVTLTGVAASDPNADTTPVCSPASLAPGATATCPATHTITQADLDAGAVTNTATGAGTPPTGEAVTDPSDPVVTPATQSPSISTVKSSPNVNVSAVGETITYQIVVKNTGNVTLTGVGVSDPMADAASVCAATSLAPGTSTTCAATHTVTQADLDAGQVVNVATSSGQPPTGAAVTASSNAVTVPVVQQTAIATTKALDPASITSYSAIGDVIRYVIAVKNNGNVTINGVTVSDPKADARPSLCPDIARPGRVGIVPGHPHRHPGRPRWRAGGQRRHRLGDARRRSGDRRRLGPGCRARRPGSVDHCRQGPRCCVDHDVFPGWRCHSLYGHGHQYRERHAWQCHGERPGGRPRIGDLRHRHPRPRRVGDVRGGPHRDPGRPRRGSVANTASASATPPSGAAAEAVTNTVTVPATVTPAVLTTKSTVAGPVSTIGEVIDYDITVRNAGNVTLTGVALDDPNADSVPTCSPTALAPGEIAICPVSHTVTQADLDAGFVDNVATGGGIGPDGSTPIDPSDPVRVPAEQLPDYTVIKSLAAGQPATYDHAGQFVDYTIVVTNTGNVTLTGVAVTDANADPGSIACDVTSIAAGQSATCAARHTVTQADVDRLSIANVAEAAATPPSGVADLRPSNEVVIAATPSPSLTTEKSSPIVDYSAVGTIITYSIVVTNTGNLTMSGIVLTDPKADPGSIACDVATLAPLASTNCTATHTVLQADLDGGSVVNTATATGTSSTGPTIQPSNSVTVPAVDQPSVLAIKRTSTLTYDAVGDPIDYSVTVQNTGNVTLTAVGITDPNADPGTIVCVPLSLAPGATATCSLTHTATQADLDRGFVLNTATAAGTPPRGDPVTDLSNEVRVDYTKISGLETLKTATRNGVPTVDFDQVGDVIPYEITVRNAGNVTVTGLALTDPVADAGTVTCDVATLAPDETARCTAEHTVTQADLDAGEVVNVATAIAVEPDGVTVTDPSNEIRLPAVLTRMLDTVKSSPTVNVALVGDVIDYMITVKNTGNVTMSAVTVTDPVADAGSIVCDTAVLAPTDTATCSATHTVTQADLDAGSVVNVATAAGTPPIGPTITDPSNEVTVPVVQSPSVVTVKSTTATTYSQPGQVITYAITVTNTGNVTITGVRVSDPKADAAPTCDVTTLAPAAVATCSATHTITQADIDAGFIDNVATSTGTPPAGPPVGDPSDVVRVTATQTPAIAVVKVSDTPDYAAVGDVIRYAVAITNTGNVTMTNVAVSDPVADTGSISCSPPTLAPTTVATCSATHTVTQADIDAGQVVNTATATADDPTGTTTTVPSNEVVVPAVQAPALLTGKVLAAGSLSSVSQVGDVISYVISLRNTGNVTLTAASAADPNADAAPVCGASVLAPGDSTTCTATHTVSQADLDAGEVLNIATGTGTPPSGPALVVPSPQVIVPATQTPAVTTAKSLAVGSINDYAIPGEVIRYAIVVTNTGNVTLTDVRATDALADAVPVCSPATLVPGAQSTCTAAHTITQVDIDRGSVVNTAVGSGVPPVGPAVVDPSDPVTVPAVQSPAIVTLKTSNTTDFDAVGDAISYAITVTNTGNVTLTDLVVADANADAPPSCSPSTLAPGDVANCTAIHTVTQADLDAGKVDNTATATSLAPGGGQVADASDQVTVPAVVLPSVSTVKTSPTLTYAAVDDVIDYSITVTNTGNVTITGVAVADPKADSAPTCTPTDLAPGASAECTATHTVTQADLDAGAVPNTATGAGFAPDGSLIADPSNEVVVPATKVSGIEVLKSSPAVNFDQVGDSLDYVITARNAGNVTLTGVTVVDPVADVGSITCAPTTLAPGDTTTCAATHTVTQADLDAGQVANIAAASATEPDGTVITGDSNEVLVPAVLTRMIDTVKSSPTTSYRTVGDVIDYEITVTNTGNVTMSFIVVTDANADTGSINCDGSTIAPTEVITCSATHTVTQGDIDAGEVLNTATGQGTPPIGPSITDRSEQIRVPAVQTPSLLTVKSTLVTSVAAVGEIIDYDITVTNTGNVTINGVVLADPKADTGSIACSAIELAPGGVSTCTATHTVTQADLDAGEILNVATATGTDPTGASIVDPSDQVRVPAIQTPGLVTAKSSPVASFASVGDVLTYDITVTNTGNVTMTDVAVVDPVADVGTLLCAPATLVPAGVMTCTARHTIVQADIDRGLVANTAIGSGDDPTGETYDDASNEVVIPAVQSPSITTTKSSPTVSVSAVGDVIDFVIAVRNSGNVTFTAVSVADAVADPGSIVCNAATLAPGDETTCTATHTVTQADLDAGQVTNVATGSGLPPIGARISDPSNPVIVPVSQTPAIAVGKTTPTVSVVAVGDVIDYTITVANTGNVTIRGITVNDPNADATPVICLADTLAPTVATACAATHTVTQADLDAGRIDNVATAGGTPPIGAAIIAESPVVSVPVVMNPQVVTDKSSPTVSYTAVGEVIDYAITVTNTGNVTVSNVKVVDPRADAEPVCTPTSLAPGGVATCPATHTVTQADLDAGSVVNTAIGSGMPPIGAEVSDASPTVTVPAVATPSLLTTKSSPTTTFAAVGDVIDYVITIRNTGNVTLTGVALADPTADVGSISCSAVTLAPGVTSTCGAAHTVTQADLDAGAVLNVATAGGNPPAGPAITQPSNQVRVDATKLSGIETLKSSPTPTYSAVGDVIDYAITVRNAGNVTVTNVAVADPIADIGATTCDVAVLAPGARATCSAHHTVTQADLDRGNTVNVATATAQEPDGAAVTDASNEVLAPATQTPEVTTTKAATTTDFDAVGDVIDYVVSVRNTGNVTLDQVAVDDPNADGGVAICPAGPLAPGATVECAAVHTVTQADLDAGRVTNVATASATPPIGAVVADGSPPVEVPAIAQPAITTAKSTTHDQLCRRRRRDRVRHHRHQHR